MMGSCPCRPGRSRRTSVLRCCSRSWRSWWQRNAIDGRIVDIVAEMDRDELCGATGARSVAALVAWKLGASSANAHHHHHRRAARAVSAAPGACGRAAVLDQVGVIARDGPPRAPMSITRSWPRSRRSTSCAPRSNSEPRPDRAAAPNRSARSPRPPPRCPPAGGSPAARRGRDLRRGLKSHHDALIAEWKADRHRWHRAVAAAAEHRRRVPAAHRGGLGRREPRSARTGRTPPSWSTSISSAAPPPAPGPAAPMPNAGI